jgi:hypothetical protein
MEKIFISIDAAGLINAKAKIEKLIIDAGRLDAIVKKFTEKRLTQEMFEDLLHNKGINTFENYRAQINDDTKKLKLKSLYAFKDILTASSDQFEQELLEVIASIKHEGLQAYASFVTITGGNATFEMEDQTRLREKFKNYARTPEEIALHEAQLEACEALNKLFKAARIYKPDISFVLPINFYGSFFDIHAEGIQAKKVQYTNAPEPEPMRA